MGNNQKKSFHFIFKNIFQPWLAQVWKVYSFEKSNPNIIPSFLTTNYTIVVCFFSTVIKNIFVLYSPCSLCYSK